MIQLQTGDRILVNSKSFLSRTIQKVMRRYAKQEGISDEYTYSHAGTIVILNGEEYVAESVENGFRLRWLFRHYNAYYDDMMIIRQKLPLTDQELVETEDEALYLQEVNNFYQYWGLLSWLLYVYVTFKWRGKYRRINFFGKGNKFSNYCYEGAYRIAKHVRPKDFQKNPEIVTCYDLYDPNRDEIVYRNKPTK